MLERGYVRNRSRQRSSVRCLLRRPPVSGYFLMRLYQGATVTKLVKSGIVPGTLGSLFIVLKTV